MLGHFAFFAFVILVTGQTTGGQGADSWDLENTTTTGATSTTGTPVPPPTKPPVLLHPPDYEFLQFNPDGEKPDARSASAAAINHDGDILVVIGGNGKDDNKHAYFLNLTSNTWHKNDLNLSKPFSSGCSAQSTGFDTEMLWMLTDGTLMAYNMTDSTITNTPTTADVAADPACAASSSAFFVFGGHIDGNCTNKVVEFHDGKWTPLFTANNPSAKLGAGLVSVADDILVLVGGLECSGQTPASIQVFRLNITEGEWVEDAPTGTLPPSRGYHTTLLNTDSMNQTLVIFGGQSATGVALDDVWTYDLVTMKWFQVPSHSGNAWPPKRHHQASAWGHGRVLLFGGVDSTGTALADTWQFIMNKPCFDRSTCDDCQVAGCGWCADNLVGFECVAGLEATGPFSPKACGKADEFLVDPEECIPEFPGWIISLTIIGCIVLVGVIVYVIMRYRNADGYQTL